jgi:hypothetical protein
MSQAEALQGWWTLTSFMIETQGVRERQQPLGGNAIGRLVLSPNGQMMAMMFAGGRKAGQSDTEQAALCRSMIAYAGSYRVEGSRFITTVSGSWNEDWTGTEQERFYELDGDRLDIVTAWAPNPFDPGSPPARGILSWRRAT